MARTDTLGNFLTDVCTAVREVSGETNKIKASELDIKIASLSGGSEPDKGIIITEWNSDGYPTVVKLKNITDIPAYAFYNYNSYSGIFTKLISINLPEGIPEIKNNTFYNCADLTITEIPSSVTKLGNGAFNTCTSLTSMTIKGNITYMDNAVFRECANLEEVIFEGSATGIQNTVFYNCKKLTKVVFKNNVEVPTLNHSNSFLATPIESGTGYIYIADDLVETMKTAANWSTYANQIKPLSELQ